MVEGNGEIQLVIQGNSINLVDFPLNDQLLQASKGFTTSTSPTQGHIFNEKALELCHWKQELVFLIQIIKSKEMKRQDIL